MRSLNIETPIWSESSTTFDDPFRIAQSTNQSKRGHGLVYITIRDEKSKTYMLGFAHIRAALDERLDRGERSVRARNVERCRLVQVTSQCYHHDLKWIP